MGRRCCADARFSSVFRGTRFDDLGGGRAESTGCVTQAGAGIAASRRSSGDFAWPLRCVCSSRVSGFSRKLRSQAGRRQMIKRLAPAVCGLFLLAGCALNPRIADLKYNPGRYQNRSVTVDGIVTSSWGVPLVPFKLYKVDDGTGELMVVSNNGL